MATTLKDVAQLAHVDICSVSRTLSGHPLAKNLREDTRQRIIEAAQKLGYRRNMFASAIRSGYNPTIAIVTDKQVTKHNNCFRLYASLMEEASKVNHALKLYEISNLDSALDDILSYHIRHILCLSPQHDQRERLALLCRQHNLNLVFMYERQHDGFPAISSDNFQMMFSLVEHVILKGHRKIAFVCSEYWNWFYMQERYNGFLAAMKMYGIEPNFAWLIFEQNPSQAVEKLLRQPESNRPTAFVCIGDGFALEVQRWAYRLGLNIPRDVSVTGFGHDPADDVTICALTTCIEDMTMIGQKALKLLLEGTIDLPVDEYGVYRCKGTMIERESVYDLNKEQENLARN